MIPELETWAIQAAPSFRAAGASPQAAAKFARLYIYLWNEGLQPRITSMYRDPARQAELQRQYDLLPGMGPRKPGFLARPATNSSHTRGAGIDMPTRDDQRAGIVAHWIGGLRVGGNFANPDWGHYDYA
jgi:D-alanyl-D-alanine dipeptidase